ncbi:MAG: oligosaccharide flippase family protein [Syntrophobacterales bacterium]|nr:oligosaccharide flippase family protein [Syntrophobacterales bacterium]
MKSFTNGYIKTWSREFGSIIKNPKELLRYKLLRQVSILLSGDAGARLLSLITLTLTVRTTGAELFGVIVVSEAYAKLIDRLFNFQSWTGIIRFGAQAIQDNNQTALKHYIRVGFYLDILSSLVGFLFAFFMAPFVVKFFKWDPTMVYAIKAYSFLVMFNFTGTAIGILRLTEKFSLLAWQRIFYASIKLIAVSSGWLMKEGLKFFLLSWVLSEILGYIFLIVSAFIVMRKKKWIRKDHGSSLSQHYSIGAFIRFTLWTNLSSTVDIPSKFLDTFIVSSFVSLEAAGVYKVFQQIGHVLKKPMEPFYQVIYPHFSNDIAKGLSRLAIKNAFRSMFFTAMIVIIFLVISIGFSSWWLPAIFGKMFYRFVSDFAIYMIITGLSVVLTNINPIFIALGFVRENFLIQAIVNLLFLVTAWIGAIHWELRGVIIAFGISILLSSFFKVVIIARRYYTEPLK